MDQKKFPKVKGISRIDIATTKGWLVRGYKNGRRYSKLFSDRKYGGIDEAFKSACDFREELCARLERLPSAQRKVKIVMKDNRNRSGVLGVSRLVKAKLKKTENGLEEVGTLGFYSVTWSPSKGTQKCTSFSITKYGEEMAFKKAVSLRYKKLAEAHGKDLATQIVGEEKVKMYVLPEVAEEVDTLYKQPAVRVPEIHIDTEAQDREVLNVAAGFSPLNRNISNTPAA